MENFKKLPKMQCFKEGGAVKAMCYGGKMKNGGHAEAKEMKKDIAQDKKIVKKAMAMHDKQEHPGEKTDLSKLKKGGRMKKEVGTVKKYKAGGAIEMKKDSGDKDDIKKVKLAKPKKAAAPSAATKDVMNTPKFFKKGGKVKKYSNGQQVKDPQKLVDEIALEENTQDREMIMKPARALGKMITKGISTAKSALKGQGAVSDAEREAVAKKKGGKIKKFNTGGSTGPLTAEEEAYLGGADRNDPFIMARMRSALGPRKQAYIPNVNPAMDNRDVGQTPPPPPVPVPYAASNVEQDSGLVYPQENELRTAPMAPRPARRPAKAPVVPQSPNVEQDSGLAYPQENELRTAPMAPRSFWKGTKGYNLSDIFGSAFGKSQRNRGYKP